MAYIICIVWTLTFLFRFNPCNGFPLFYKGNITSDFNTYYVGEVMTLNCSSLSPLEDVRFTYGSDLNISSEYVTVVNETLAQLNKPILDNDFYSTTYSCWSNSSPIAQKFIYTEFYPQNVTNPHFVWYNKNQVNFTWDLGVPYKSAGIMTLITPEWTADKITWYPCNNTTNSSCLILDYNNLWVTVRVTIKNVRRNDSSISLYPDILLTNYTKPPPVSGLTVLNKNSTCLQLSWNVSLSGAKFMVTYSQIGQASTSNHSIETMDQTVIICSLQPYHNYLFSVQAIPVYPYSGYPSDPVTVTQQMDEAAPACGPQVTLNSYFRAPCLDRNFGQVNIYFQPVPDDYRNGIVTKYSVSVIVDGQNKSQDYSTQGPEQLYITVTVPCETGFTALLYAYTLGGRSLPVELYIPPLQKDLYKYLTDVDLQIKDDGSGDVVATWKIMENLLPHSFFLYYFWDSPSIKGLIELVNINYSAGEHHWNVSNANQFGVAIVTTNNESSGIDFTDCIYNPSEKDVPTPVTPVPVADSYSVYLYWSYPRCNQIKKVMTYGYEIKSCEEPIGNCNIYTVNDGAASRYYLGSLKPATNYSIVITANTTSGISHPSEKAFTMLLPVGETQTGLVVGVTLATLVVVLVIGISIVSIWRKFKEKSNLYVKMEYTKPQSKSESASVESGYVTSQLSYSSSSSRSCGGRSKDSSCVLSTSQDISEELGQMEDNHNSEIDHASIASQANNVMLHTSYVQTSLVSNATMHTAYVQSDEVSNATMHKSYIQSGEGSNVTMHTSYVQLGEGSNVTMHTSYVQSGEGSNVTMHTSYVQSGEGSNVTMHMSYVQSGEMTNSSVNDIGPYVQTCEITNSSVNDIGPYVQSCEITNSSINNIGPYVQSSEITNSSINNIGPYVQSSEITNSSVNDIGPYVQSCEINSSINNIGPYVHSSEITNSSVNDIGPYVQSCEITNSSINNIGPYVQSSEITIGSINNIGPYVQSSEITNSSVNNFCSPVQSCEITNSYVNNIDPYTQSCEVTNSAMDNIGLPVQSCPTTKSSAHSIGPHDLYINCEPSTKSNVPVKTATVMDSENTHSSCCQERQSYHTLKSQIPIVGQQNEESCQVTSSSVLGRPPCELSTIENSSKPHTDNKTNAEATKVIDSQSGVLSRPLSYSQENKQALMTCQQSVDNFKDPHIIMQVCENEHIEMCSKTGRNDLCQFSVTISNNSNSSCSLGDEGKRPEHDEGKRPEHDEETRPEHDEGTRPEHDEGTRPKQDEGTRAEHDEGTKPEHDEGNKT